MASTTTGYSLPEALRRIMRLRDEQTHGDSGVLIDWTSIGEAVGLPHQTCAALARVVDAYADELAIVAISLGHASWAGQKLPTSGRVVTPAGRTIAWGALA